MFKSFLSFIKDRWLYFLLVLLIIAFSLFGVFTCSSCKSSENIVVEDTRSISVPC